MVGGVTAGGGFGQITSGLMLITREGGLADGG